MNGWRTLDPRSLAGRLIFGFLIVILGALAALGIPIWVLVQGNLTRPVFLVLLTSALLAGLLAIAWAFFLAHRLAEPLHALVRASRQMGYGDLATPIATGQGVTEIETLAFTLEHMRERLHRVHDDLARANAWSENLIASLAEGVLTVDQAGRITFFSPGAEQILGWQATDVIGRSYESVFNLALVEHPAPGVVTRHTTATRGGRSLVLMTTSGAVTTRQDGVTEQAFVFRDVTEQEQAQRLREFFLANVSHELKTPLTAIHASIELLATDLPSLARAEQEELVNSLWIGLLRLEELVDNLLSSASLQSGNLQVQPRPSNLEDLLEEVLVTTRPLLSVRGQELELDVPGGLPEVWADRRRITQVLNNLISNACKFGPRDQPITVRVQPRGAQVLVSVLDRGPGVKAEAQAQLFQPFKRSDDTTQGGVGLGLAIVKSIIERHSGEVGYRRTRDHGTAFWFTLPVAPLSPASAPTVTGDAAAPEKV